jgi:hypothetical protein
LLPTLIHFGRIIRATHCAKRYNTPDNRGENGTQTITTSKTLKHPLPTRHDRSSPKWPEAKAIDGLDHRVNNPEKSRPSVVPTNWTISCTKGTICKKLLNASILR